MAQLDAEEKGVSPDDYLASVHKELLDFYERREDGSQEVWDRREQLLDAVQNKCSRNDGAVRLPCYAPRREELR